MSQENDSDESDDEFCCKFTTEKYFMISMYLRFWLPDWLTDNFFSFIVLTPNIHQYNITEKIKEANSILFSETQPRQSQPKVKFRDKLVDYECESMENQPHAVVDEVSDDGYSEEIVDVTEKVDEAIEIEEVCEQIQQQFVENGGNDEKELIEDESYDKESFHDEFEVNLSEKPKESPEKPQKKTTFRPKSSNKVNPMDVETRKNRRKDCCSFKETDEYKKSLPLYNGSTYGLSKEEKNKREFIRYQRAADKQQRLERKMEEKEFLAKTNEEAFSKW